MRRLFKNTKTILLVGLTVLTLHACSKDPDVEPGTNAEYLSSDEAEALEQIESIQLDSKEVILPNELKLDAYLKEVNPHFYTKWSRVKAETRLGPQDARNLLIANMGKVALKLTSQGLGYGAGLKDPTQPSKPTDGQCNRDTSYKGLDCSGLLYQLFTNAGIRQFPVGTADLQRKPATIETYIKQMLPEWTTLKVEDMKSLEASKIEVGDIIYWSRDGGKTAFHIGMVMKDTKGQLAVAQSNGYWEDCNKKKVCGLCARNVQPGTYRVGPRFSMLSKAIAKVKDGGFADYYGVVRINAGISGKWTVSIRCENTTFEFLNLELDFPTTQDNSFTLTKSAIYKGNGVLYDLTFDFKYTRETNTLSCTYKTTASQYTDYYRYDSFSVELKRDKVDYFNVTLGDNRNAGCPYEVALTNQTRIDVSKLIL